MIAVDHDSVAWLARILVRPDRCLVCNLSYSHACQPIESTLGETLRHRIRPRPTCPYAKAIGGIPRIVDVRVDNGAMVHAPIAISIDRSNWRPGVADSRN